MIRNFFLDLICFRLPAQCEDEEDMLDLALGVCDTSRLGCQVKVKDSFEGIKVKIPKEGANFL